MLYTPWILELKSDWLNCGILGYGNSKCLLMCTIWRLGHFTRHKYFVLREAGKSEEMIPCCFPLGCWHQDFARYGNCSGPAKLFPLLFPLNMEGYSSECCGDQLPTKVIFHILFFWKSEICASHFSKSLWIIFMIETKIQKRNGLIFHSREVTRGLFVQIDWVIHNLLLFLLHMAN